MLINQDDYWECPDCHLQAAGSEGVFMILRERGIGDFKSHRVAATEYVVGAFIKKQSATDPWEADGYFDNEADFRAFLANNVTQPQG